jgi:hypothetical protein
MRRIDLLCKLLGPLVISSISLASTLVAIWATLTMNVLSVLIEYVCIEQVRYSPQHAVPILFPVTRVGLLACVHICTDP